jgi:hypothetical protein
MMGCLCFLLNRPPLIMINVLQNSMVTLCSFTLGTVKLGLFYLWTLLCFLTFVVMFGCSALKQFKHFQMN